MIGKRFSYKRPCTIEEAVAALASAGDDARVLSGGTSLVPALTAGVTAPSMILDLGGLGLNRIEDCGGEVRIGVTTTYATLAASNVIYSKLPLLADMVRQVTGGPGLWNLATLGGASCYANPASDGPGCLAALNATFELASREGSRLVNAQDFFLGAFKTACGPREMVTAMIVPTASRPHRCVYLKVKNAASSWPIVCVSALLQGSGNASQLRVCIGGAAATPSVSEWTVSNLRDVAEINEFAHQACAALNNEWSDELAGPGYRRSIAPTVVARALRAIATIPSEPA